MSSPGPYARSVRSLGLVIVLLMGGCASSPAAVRPTTPARSRSPAPRQEQGRSSSAPIPGRSAVVATVVIDPGHNAGNATHRSEVNRLVDAVTLRKPCDTTGTSTAAGYPESSFNLDVSERLAIVLRASGVRAVLTRTSETGWGPCITDRAAIGNRDRADAAISIHADGGPPTGRGFHIIEPAAIAGVTDQIVGPSRRLGVALRDAYLAMGGMPLSTYAGKDGIDVRSDLGGLNLSKVPKVFIECGNMRNATDAASLSNPAFREHIARALAAGIDAFLRDR